MADSYKRLKKMVGKETSTRFQSIEEEIRSLALEPRTYEVDSTRGIDKHLAVSFGYDNTKELWLTANYDTFNNSPSANNNASGVVTLLGLAERLKEVNLPIDVKLWFLDAGLDPSLAAKRKRDPNFIPGSKLLLAYLVENEIEFLDRYEGVVTVQAVGKGHLTVFNKTGKKESNSPYLNAQIVRCGQDTRTQIDQIDNSPLADNLSFLREGLDATVVSRYHEGAWHRMQTSKDDMTNVNPKTIDDTIGFLGELLEMFTTK